MARLHMEVGSCSLLRFSQAANLVLVRIFMVLSDQSALTRRLFMAVATPLDRDQFDAALFNWLRTKMDVHGCKSLDELIALVALGERFDFRPLSKLPLFDRIGVAMVGLKKITCNKCDRQWNEPLQERIVTN